MRKWVGQKESERDDLNRCRCCFSWRGTINESDCIARVNHKDAANRERRMEREEKVSPQKYHPAHLGHSEVEHTSEGRTCKLHKANTDVERWTDIFLPTVSAETSKRKLNTPVAGGH